MFLIQLHYTFTDDCTYANHYDEVKRVSSSFDLALSWVKDCGKEDANDAIESGAERICYSITEFEIDSKLPDPTLWLTIGGEMEDYRW